ncbi:MAG: dihydrofolate reductase, partial [Pseudomonadota bacterium]
TSIVVTRDERWQGEGAVAVRSLDIAFETARAVAASDGVEEICVVGGGEIYRQAMAHATRLCLTEVQMEPEGDTYFSFDRDAWGLVSKEEVPAGEKDSAPTVYSVYVRPDVS